MKLIAGLGNPGEKYRFTRHNIGFLIIDHIAGSFKSYRELNTPLYEAVSPDSETPDFVLLKPHTYMNRSGIALAEFMNSNEIPLENLLVIVDDFNIPLGTIRIRKNGSDGGHNGLVNIAEVFETEDYPRMRIGIGPQEPITKEDYIDFVLTNFTEKEFEIIDKMMPIYEKCVQSFISDGITKTMNNYNKSFIEEISE